MNDKLLITGGSGYVGGRIAQFLAQETDFDINVGTRSQLPDISWLPKATALNIDYASQISLEAACEGSIVVIHLAAVDENYSTKFPAEAVSVNTVNTVRLIEAAKKQKVKRLIFFSTAHVYGSPLQGDIDEETCCYPCHPYAISHRAAEDFVLACRGAGALEVIVVRMSNSFGAPAHPNVNRWTLLVNDLCMQAVLDQKLKLKSHGLQRRDFIALSDVCRATKHMIEMREELLGNGIFNLGGAWAPTVWEMALLVTKRCGAVLGYAPEIIRTQPNEKGKSENLNYKVDKLFKTGFKLEKNHEFEIDETLMFCLRFKTTLKKVCSSPRKSIR